MTGRTMRALLVRLWRQHFTALSVIACGLALFEVVITRIAPSQGQAGFVGGLLALLPKEMSAFAEGQLALATPQGVLAFGYLHPFFLTLLSAWIIRVAAGSLAGEIGRGTFDLLASRPIPRWAHVLAAWLTIALGLGILAAAAWSGMALGLQLRSLGVTAAQVAAVPASAWLLFVSWTGMALLFSAIGRESGSAIAWTAGVIAVSFVLEFLARVWQPLGWARWLSLFTYYQPQNIVETGLGWHDGVVLAVVSLAGLGAALVVFERRDV
ncbi:MAG TPA: ABC transporter permease [Vicinamibacterales bacterium]|nr:ABC transporter permease [Vicinamibacterales bacterium]